MGRQRFLHHYLPAHLASAMVTGALVEFIFNLQPVSVGQGSTDGEEDPSGKAKASISLRHYVTAKERMGTKSFIAGWIATLVILGEIIRSIDTAIESLHMSDSLIAPMCQVLFNLFAALQLRYFHSRDPNDLSRAVHILEILPQFCETTHQWYWVN